MAVSKKRKTRSKGQKNIAKFRRGVLEHTRVTNPAAIERTIVNLFPWIDDFDEETRKDCLTDLTSATIEAAGNTESESFMDSLSVWQKVHEKLYPDFYNKVEPVTVNS